MFFRNFIGHIKKITIFIKNVWFFRSELANFGGWDWTHSLSMLKRSLMIQEMTMKNNSKEVEDSLNSKLDNMRRAIYLIDMIVEDNFIEIAEKSLGVKFEYSDLNIDKTGKLYSKNLNSDTNNMLLKEASRIEKGVWDELFSILRNDLGNWWY